MVRLGKLTDYAVVIMSHLAQEAGLARSAQEVAQQLNLALPTVSKILKVLARAGLLLSQRGARGGYRLARAAEQITLVEVIDAMEGPFALTECSVGEGICSQEGQCRLPGSWRQINRMVRSTLEGVSLAQMLRPGGVVVP